MCMCIPSKFIRPGKLSCMAAQTKVGAACFHYMCIELCSIVYG